MTNIVNAVIDALAPIVIDIVVSVVGILFALLLGKLRKVAALQHLTGALANLQDAVITTVYANQQALVDGWKSAAADGKLTPEEIATLNARTIDRVKTAIGPNIVEIITAAGIDIDTLILDSADAVIHDIKDEK